LTPSRFRGDTRTVTCRRVGSNATSGRCGESAGPACTDARDFVSDQAVPGKSPHTIKTAAIR
jgi:hypothetical protein